MAGARCSCASRARWPLPWRLRRRGAGAGARPGWRPRSSSTAATSPSGRSPSPSTTPPTATSWCERLALDAAGFADDPPADVAARGGGGQPGRRAAAVRRGGVRRRAPGRRRRGPARRAGRRRHGSTTCAWSWRRAVCSTGCTPASAPTGRCARSSTCACRRSGRGEGGRLDGGAGARAPFGQRPGDGRRAGWQRPVHGATARSRRGRDAAGHAGRDASVLELPLQVTSTRCDVHAFADSKRSYVLASTSRSAAASRSSSTTTAEPALQRQLDRLAADTCRPGG